MTTTTNQKLNSEQIEFCKQFADENSQIILSDLGLDVDSDGSVKCACPIHGGDNKHGFGWSDSKKIWSCWTNKCHIKYGRSIIGLIAGINNLSFYDACRWVISKYNLDIDNVDISTLETKKFIRKNTKVEKSPDKFYSLRAFKHRDEHVSYLEKRGFSKEIIKEFNCFICKEYGHPLFERIVIPIKNDDDKIVGFTARNGFNSPFENKWIHYPNHIATSKILFGINEAKKYISISKEVIIVEAPLDMMKLYQNGIKNTVALLGSDINIERIKLLLKYNVQKIILALDPDVAGQTAANIIKDYTKLYFNVTNITDQLKNDPADMSDQEIKECFNVFNT